MKVLVTGADGQLGADLVIELEGRNHIPIGVSSAEMNITQKNCVTEIMSAVRPDAVIHCAAYTNVEEAEGNIEICKKTNVDGTDIVARTCKAMDIPMIYISTDYVFDGHGNQLWKPNDQANPLNIYGRTKYEGELSVLSHLQKYYIVRISWLFGKNGDNFVKSMLKQSSSHRILKVVDDQFGSPTYTVDLSRLLVDMIESNNYGIYHASNEGFCSWYEFASEIFRQIRATDIVVLPVESNFYLTKAQRPLNSRMSKDKLLEQGYSKLPTWQNALERYLVQMGCFGEKQGNISIENRNKEI